MAAISSSILKTDAVSNPFDSFDIVLESADSILGFDATPNPSVDTWTSYKVRLDESAGWKVTPEVSEAEFASFSTLPAPTAAQMKAVLGSLTGLLIRGEFQTGADTGALDNVKFGSR